MEKEKASDGSRYTEKLSLSNITLPLQNLIHCKNLIRLEFCQSIPSMWCSRKNRCCLLFEECRGIFHCTVQLCTNVQHVYSMCTLTDDFSSLKLSRQFYGWGGDDGRWSCLNPIVMWLSFADLRFHLKMTEAALELKRWALNEMGYDTPCNIDNLSSVCTGPMSGVWRYLRFCYNNQLINSHVS